jgi:hypothetical protein
VVHRLRGDVKKVEIMIISPDLILDDLKLSIVQQQPANFTLRSTNIVHFQDTTLPRGGQRIIEVDFSLSTMPHSLDRIHVVERLPLAPYPYILLRKLQDWYNLQKSSDVISTSTAKGLANDILTMLKQLNVQAHIRPGGPFDPQLQGASVERVVKFYAAYAMYKPEWQRLGFSPVVPLQTKAKTPGVARAKQPKASGSTPAPQVTTAAQLGFTVSLPSLKSSVAAPQTAKTPKSPATVTSAGVAGPSVAPQKPPRESKRNPQISRTQIRNMAAKSAVAILSELGIPCAIFGSMACRLFGNPRPPNVSFQKLTYD